MILRPLLVLPAVLFALCACQVATPCESRTCAGCCTEGECLHGGGREACGTAAQQCVACSAGEACTAGACRTLEPDGGVFAFEGTLWVMGNLIDETRFDVARVSARLGLSELVTGAPGDALSSTPLSAAVSDDGRWLALVMRSEETSRTDLVLSAVDGTGSQRLGAGQAQQVLRVSSQSVIWLNEAREVLVTPLDGSSTVRATPQPWAAAPDSPMWVADSLDHRYVSVVGAQAALPRSFRVWVTDRWAPSPTPIEVFTSVHAGSSPTTLLGAEGFASFSADGRVLFKARFDGSSGLPLSLPGGGRAARLMSAAVDGSEVELLPYSASGAQQLGAWGISGDATRVAFAMNSGSGGDDVYVSPANGSAIPRRVSAGHEAGGGPPPESSLAFSPDGRLLAFTSNWVQREVADLYVVSTAGGLELLRFPLQAGAQVQGPVRWSPDSRHLVFNSDHLAPAHPEAFFMEALGWRTVPVRAWPLAAAGRVAEVRWTAY